MTEHLMDNEAKILHLLVANHHYMAVEELAAKLGSSKRSIYYLLQRVSQLLIQNHIEPPRNIRGQGYYLPDTSRQAVTQLLTAVPVNPQSDGQRISAANRRLLMVTMLFTGKTPVTITTLMTLTGAARNTIVNDFSYLEHALKPRKISLIANTRGHMLTGSELLIRNFFQDFLRAHFPLPAWPVTSITDKSLQDDVKDIYGLTQMLNDWLHQTEKKRGQSFSDDAIRFLEMFYAMVLTRILNHRVLLKNEFPAEPADRTELDTQQEYGMASDFLEQLGIHNQEEVFYLESLLLSSQLNEVSANSDAELKQSVRLATRAVIKNFKQLSEASFHDDDQLERELYVHLLSTYYRVKYQRQFHNAMVAAIQKNYPDVYTYTKMSIRPFEKLNDQLLSDDEISLIPIYFGAQLYRTVSDSQTVLLVCSTGLGTSRLLKQQLESAFPELQLAGPITKQDFQRMSDKHYPLVLSTIPLQAENQPIIVVQPVMNEEELETLRKKLVARNIITATETNNRLSALLDVIADNTEIKNQTALVTGIKEVLSFAIRPLGTYDRRYQPLLSELINPDTIQFKQAKAMDWEQAITVAASPLERNGNIKKSYIAAMISNVKKNGPYINIGDRVALAHARPEDGVTKLGMSFMKLDKPIPLIDDDHPIQLIFVLAAADSRSHLKALSELASILGDKQRLQRLYTADSPADIEQIIAEGEKIK